MTAFLIVKKHYILDLLLITRNDKGLMCKFLRSFYAKCSYLLKDK